MPTQEQLKKVTEINEDADGLLGFFMHEEQEQRFKSSHALYDNPFITTDPITQSLMEALTEIKTKFHAQYAACKKLIQNFRTDPAPQATYEQLTAKQNELKEYYQSYQDVIRKISTRRFKLNGASGIDEARLTLKTSLEEQLMQLDALVTNDLVKNKEHPLVAGHTAKVIEQVRKLIAVLKHSALQFDSNRTDPLVHALEERLLNPLTGSPVIKIGIQFRALMGNRPDDRPLLQIFHAQWPFGQPDHPSRILRGSSEEQRHIMIRESLIEAAKLQTLSTQLVNQSLEMLKQGANMTVRTNLQLAAAPVMITPLADSLPIAALPMLPTFDLSDLSKRLDVYRAQTLAWEQKELRQHLDLCHKKIAEAEQSIHTIRRMISTLTKEYTKLSPDHLDPEIMENIIRQQNAIRELMMQCQTKLDLTTDFKAAQKHYTAVIENTKKKLTLDINRMDAEMTNIKQKFGIESSPPLDIKPFKLFENTCAQGLASITAIGDHAQEVRDTIARQKEHTISDLYLQVIQDTRSKITNSTDVMRKVSEQCKNAFPDTTPQVFRDLLSGRETFMNGILDKLKTLSNNGPENEPPTGIVEWRKKISDLHKCAKKAYLTMFDLHQTLLTVINNPVHQSVQQCLDTLHNLKATANPTQQQALNDIMVSLENINRVLYCFVEKPAITPTTKVRKAAEAAPQTSEEDDTDDDWVMIDEHTQSSQDNTDDEWEEAEKDFDSKGRPTITTEEQYTTYIAVTVRTAIEQAKQLSKKFIRSDLAKNVETALNVLLHVVSEERRSTMTKEQLVRTPTDAAAEAPSLPRPRGR